MMNFYDSIILNDYFQMIGDSGNLYIKCIYQCVYMYVKLHTFLEVVHSSFRLPVTG